MKTSKEEISEYYISKPVKKKLLLAKDEVINGDDDKVFIVDGQEGSGKSTLAMQLAAHLDPSFCLKDIVFNASEFEKRIREVDRHKAIIFDEAFNGLSSRGSLSKENKNLVRLLMECRQRNLFVFIVLPSFFLIDQYISNHRANGLFHCFKSKKNSKRRGYKIYTTSMMQKLNLFGRKTMSYYKPQVFELHRFYGKYPSQINEQEYRDKKFEAFKDESGKEVEETRYKIQRDNLLHILTKECKVNAVQLEKYMNNYPFPLKTSIIRSTVRDVTKKAMSGKQLYNINSDNSPSHHHHTKEDNVKDIKKDIINVLPKEDQYKYFQPGMPTDGTIKLPKEKEQN